MSQDRAEFSIAEDADEVENPTRVRRADVSTASLDFVNTPGSRVERLRAEDRKLAGGSRVEALRREVAGGQP